MSAKVDLYFLIYYYCRVFNNGANESDCLAACCRIKSCFKVGVIILTNLNVLVGRNYRELGEGGCSEYEYARICVVVELSVSYYLGNAAYCNHRYFLVINLNAVKTRVKISLNSDNDKFCVCLIYLRNAYVKHYGALSRVYRNACRHILFGKKQDIVFKYRIRYLRSRGNFRRGSGLYIFNNNIFTIGNNVILYSVGDINRRSVGCGNEYLLYLNLTAHQLICDNDVVGVTVRLVRNLDVYNRSLDCRLESKKTCLCRCNSGLKSVNLYVCICFKSSNRRVRICNCLFKCCCLLIESCCISLVVNCRLEICNLIVKLILQRLY